MQEAPEKKPLCPGLSLGMSMNISFEGVGTVKSTLIGMEYGLYLIVKLPPIQDISTKLYQKNHIVVRYFYDGNAYGFRTTLNGLVKDPFRLYFLAYPEVVESLNLRKNERHVCLIPAHIGSPPPEGGKMDFRGCISDISLGGCSFECTEHCENITATLAVGSIVQLFFRFPGEEAWRTILSEVRSLRSDQRKLLLGLRYHLDPNQSSQLDTLGVIQDFIDYLRK